MPIKKGAERRRNMSSKKQRRVLILVVGLIFSILSIPAMAADFPTKPIEISVGFEPGAGTDLSARVFAKEAEKLLGVPVVVTNKPGGNSSIAAALVAKKKADGYSLGAINSTSLTGSHIMTRNVSYNPFKDLTYILAWGRYNAGAICVQKESPFKTLKELVEHSRKNPRSLSYSTSGAGGISHLAIEYFAKKVGVKFNHVPFKGGTPAITALLGGHVDFYSGTGSHLNYVRQGLWRQLAITLGKERAPEFPDVPTLEELGYGCPAAAAAMLLCAPGGLPDPIFKKLEPAFRQAIHSPELLETLKKLDMPFIFLDRRKVEEEISANYKFFSDFINELGLLKK